jgi:RNA polymerase sigma factor (sigma-70 family)
VTASSSTRNRALTETVESQRARLMSVIRRMIGDQAEAEDIAQDVFAEFVEAYDLGVAIETIGAWMIRVARNKVLDRFRRRKTQEEYRLQTESSTEDEEAADPGNDWLRESLRKGIIAALEELPPEQRDVFIRNELEGKSFEEIAAETGVGVNTLLARKRYAILALREHLKEIYDEL